MNYGMITFVSRKRLIAYRGRPVDVKSDCANIGNGLPAHRATREQKESARRVALIKRSLPVACFHLDLSRALPIPLTARSHGYAPELLLSEISHLVAKDTIWLDVARTRPVPFALSSQANHFGEQTFTLLTTFFI
jgi:hypothetical protein